MTMVGTLKINWIAASLAGLITFSLSIGNNVFLTTCLRSLYSFIILFILTFGFRFLLGILTTANGLNLNEEHLNEAESHLGSQLDLATPDDDDATRQMLKKNLDSPGQSSGAEDMPFSPLNPPKLVTKNNLDPEQLAGALRRMSED
ncbi:hypothetical protein [Paenibacillus eucommiae]|uniref:Uncharacterized protein n=1 Tax=Paenibacillus eucommiae TaxID=1355755 RepID=A0ABS4IUP8_9BACL|nr:hypothetical protein [Paenibacillus eucommiae]MBP1991313.1 hypothetical protein [Paenibacillus eucommiae]